MTRTTDELIVEKSFSEISLQLKNNIQQEGFLLLHEINTQQILKGHGYNISQLCQLLFFHPRYMNEILMVNPSDVIKVPLKIVIREIHEKCVALTCTDAKGLFVDCHELQSLTEELEGKIKSIMQL